MKKLFEPIRATITRRSRNDKGSTRDRFQNRSRIRHLTKQRPQVLHFYPPRSKFENSLTNTSKLFHPSPSFFLVTQTPSNTTNISNIFESREDEQSQWLLTRVYRRVGQTWQLLSQVQVHVVANPRCKNGKMVRSIRGEEKSWRASQCTRAAVTCSGCRSHWSKRAELQLRRRLQGNRKPSRCSIQVQRYSGTD